MSAWTKHIYRKEIKTYRKYEDKKMKKDNCDLSSHCESSLPLSLFDIDT